MTLTGAPYDSLLQLHSYITLPYAAGCRYGYGSYLDPGTHISIRGEYTDLALVPPPTCPEATPTEAALAAAGASSAGEVLKGATGPETAAAAASSVAAASGQRLPQIILDAIKQAEEEEAQVAAEAAAAEGKEATQGDGSDSSGGSSSGHSNSSGHNRRRLAGLVMAWPSAMLGGSGGFVRKLAAVRPNTFTSTCHCWVCPRGTRTPPFTREIAVSSCLPKTVRQAVRVNITTADGGCSAQHAKGVEDSVRTHLRSRGASVGSIIVRCVPHVKANETDLQVGNGAMGEGPVRDGSLCQQHIDDMVWLSSTVPRGAHRCA